MADVQQLVLRLDRNVYEQLKLVSETSHVTMNKFAQQAIVQGLARASGQLADELSPRLEKLKRFAANPTGLSGAIRAFADGEATYGKHDPAEGRHVHTAAVTGTKKAARGVSRAGGAARKKRSSAGLGR